MNYFFWLPLLLLSACNKHRTPQPPPQAPIAYDSVPTAHLLTPLINEISGIAGSQTVPNTLWAQEDSGNPPQLYSINKDGTVRKKVFIDGATNRDWEDIGLAGNDLYIGEIGDNKLRYDEYAFYKFPEPDAVTDTIYAFEKIRFRYADGPHNAEAFLIDPATKAIYIITKNDSPSGIYKIASPRANGELNTAEKVGTLSYSGVTSAALSPDGREIIVKTYTALYHYSRQAQPLEEALAAAPVPLAYQQELQGEAICFALDNSGFFTLSEKGFGTAVNLYFYKRR